MPTPSEADQLTLLSFVQSNNPEDYISISNLLTREPDLANIKFKDPEDGCENSILYYAAQSGNKKACELLIDNNARVNDGSRPAIFGAITSGHIDIVQLMIQTDESSINVTNHQLGFDRPLHVAAKVGSAEICRFLVANGAKPHYNKDAKKPIDYAANSDIREALHSQDIDNQQQDSSEETPLMAEETRSASSTPEPRSSHRVFEWFMGNTRK